VATDCVTGAFGYTGGYISQRLLAEGRQVRTLTNHPDSSTQIEKHPLAFADHSALVASLRGVSTLYNTYWVRYLQGGTSYDQAVANTIALLTAAREARVERLVHVSITKPSHDSFYAYYRGKAALEDAIRASGLSYAIVRPTVLFGGNDIFVNNIAWLVRRFHLFAIPGDGRYRLRPVAVDDLADLCVRLGAERDNTTIDAVGPETYAFEDLVRLIARSVGAWCLPVNVPPVAVLPFLKAIGAITGDVVLTRDEIAGLMAELICVDGAATCPTRLSDYLKRRGTAVGARYQSELARRGTRRETSMG
jgi:uncharacterized protein YbjT (DUF2867 family)